MKANSQPPIGLVLVFVALALALTFSCPPVSLAQEQAVPVAQSTRQPPGPSRPDPGPSRPQPTGPTAPAPGPGGPDTTATPPVLPPAGGASAADFNWLLAGLALSGAGVYVIQNSRRRG
jgi:hypothetical protein